MHAIGLAKIKLDFPILKEWCWVKDADRESLVFKRDFILWFLETLLDLLRFVVAAGDEVVVVFSFFCGVADGRSEFRKWTREERHLNDALDVIFVCFRRGVVNLYFGEEGGGDPRGELH